MLKPFWRYYGGKFRAAPRYPKPQFGTIVEPFAGAAGYSLRYPDRRVVLVERYHVIAEIWRWLIRASAAEVRAIPLVEHVDDLPGATPIGARWLVGFNMNQGTVSPCRSLSAGIRRQRESGHHVNAGWSADQRERVASQVEHIRHWRVIEDDWFRAPLIEATWFVDPPYTNRAGSHYKHGPDGIDYDLLARGCHVMPGQVIVCENEGASWLPFRPFGTFKPNAMVAGSTGSREVIWTKEAV